MFRPVARWQPKPVHCLKKWSSAIGIGFSLFFPPHSLSALRQEIKKEVSTPTQHWDGWLKRRKNERQRKKWEVKPRAATFYRAWLIIKKKCAKCLCSRLFSSVLQSLQTVTKVESTRVERSLLRWECKNLWVKQIIHLLACRWFSGKCQRRCRREIMLFVFFAKQRDAQCSRTWARWQVCSFLHLHTSTHTFWEITDSSFLIIESSQGF